MQQPTVMIVEPSRLQRLVLQRLLEANGFAVCQADSAAEALELTASESVSLVMVDFSLLQEAGIDWCDSLRRLSGQRALPVVAISSSSGSERLQAAKSLGADEVTTSPYQEQALSELLQRLLSPASEDNSESILAQENRSLRRQVAAFSQLLERGQTALETRQRFLINLNHEVRTPLNAVLGLIYLMRRQTTEAERTLYMDQLEATGIKLLGAFDHNLATASLASDSARHICNRVMQRIATDYAGCELLLDQTQDTEPLVGPIRMVEEALYNLAEFACRHTVTDGAELQLGFDVQALSQNGRLTLRFWVVYPAGSAQVQSTELLFDRAALFAESLPAPTDAGLVLAHAVAAHLGGRAELESVQQGNRLSITLNLLQYSDVTSQPEAAPVAVVVDDEPINRRITASFLEKSGLRVRTFSSGLDLIEHLGEGEHHYDLIFMDLIMPDISGIEATKRIRSLERWASIPIVALSANSDAATRAACESAGCNDFLEKSSDPAPLYAALEKWLPDLHRQKEASALELAPTSLDEEEEQIWFAQLEAAFPMMDVKAAARLGSGGSGAFEPLLTEFQNRYSACTEQLAAYIHSEDFTGAERLVHSIKGAAGTLGLNQISDQARRVESLLLDRNLARLIAPLVELERQIDQFSEACDQWRSPSGSASASSQQDFDQVLDQLLGLVRQDNPLAREYFESQGLAIKTVAPALYQALDEATANYDLLNAGLMIEAYRRKAAQQLGADNDQ